MARRKGKSVSFDAMIKFFLHNYNIPTKKDFNKVMTRIDQLEAMIKKTFSESKWQDKKSKKRVKEKTLSDTSPTTAGDQVLGVIKRFKNGVDLSGIQSKTGFGEKKLRNIIFRLNKTGKIKRKSRGIYIAS